MDHPSPASSMLGNLPLPPSHMPGMMSNGMSSDMFGADFMSDITTELVPFDPIIFRDAEDLNFERDFALWFNPNEVKWDGEWNREWDSELTQTQTRRGDSITVDLFLEGGDYLHTCKHYLSWVFSLLVFVCTISPYLVSILTTCSQFVLLPLHLRLRYRVFCSLFISLFLFVYQNPLHFPSAFLWRAG